MSELPNSEDRETTRGSRDLPVTESSRTAGTILDGETIALPASERQSQQIHLGGLGSSPDPVNPEPPAISVRRPLPAEIRGTQKYEVGRMVSRGGMGVIMSARDIIVQREVAMKLMHDGAQPSAVARFFQEAQIAAQLEHPNIVPVHEINLNADDLPFYTMRLVRGVSLKNVLERLANDEPAAVREWPLSALLTIFQKVCDAIAFAHARRVIHRDLKPENIMLGRYGEAQVTDWGLAKVLGTEVAAQTPETEIAEELAPAMHAGETTVGPTISGTVLGTPQYMPPEQAEGAVEQMDERTDLYSLGAILYHVLALRPPFAGRNSAEVLENVRAGKILPLVTEKAGKRLPHLPGGRLPESLAAVAMKAMAREKVARYPAVQLLQRDIAAYQNGFATSAEEAGWMKLAGLFLRRHRTISGAAALLLLVGIIFSFHLARERDRARAASAQAQAARRLADEQRDTAENQLYLSDMLQAGRHLADGRPGSARELLQRHRREPSGRDLRSWEWYHLVGEANRDALRVQAHAGGVFAVAASSDGTRLATGGGDGEVAIWQTRGLVPQQRFALQAGAVLTVAWHSEGRWLAAGTADGLVRIWDLSTQKSVSEFRLESGAAVRSLGWRPADGGTPVLAIGSLDKEVRIWRQFDAAANAPETFAQSAQGVAALHWSADGQRLAIGKFATANALEVYEFTSRARLLSTNLTTGDDAFAVALDPTGKYVAAGSKHLLVVVYEVASKKLIQAETAHHGFVSALAWNPDGSRLASAGHDGTIRLCLPMQSKGLVQLLSGHEGEVNALVWAKLPHDSEGRPAGSALFSGGADGTLRAWRSIVGNAISVRDSNWIAAANWNPEGTRLAVVNFRNQIQLVDPASSLSVSIFATFGNLFDVAWSPDGRRLATASRGNDCVEVFDASSGRPLGLHGLARAYRVAWSPSGQHLAACGSEGARVWDVGTGALVATILRPSGSVLWHADGRRLLLGCSDGAIEVWDAFAGKKEATWRAAPAADRESIASEIDPPRQVFDLRFSPDGRQLAFATQDCVVGLHDARDGRVIRAFTGLTGGVWRVAWSHDGRRLASVGQDGILRIYDVATGGQVAQISHGLGTNEVHSLDWSRDGRRLVSGGFDRLIRIWDTRRGKQIDAVEQMLARADNAPPSLELARAYARLGWVDDTRRTFATRRGSASADDLYAAELTQTESAFARTLDSSHRAQADGGDDLRRIFELLGSIQERWEAGKADGALSAWRELAKLPAAAEWLPFARTYFSRARWSAKWFASSIDPLADLAGWRAQAVVPEAVNAPVRTLIFPYRNRGPKDLLLARSLTERGPGAGAFGMVARARIELPAGKWRLQTAGRDGARVSLNDQPVLENWSANAPAEKSVIFEQSASGPVEFLVEHFVTDRTADFEFLLEPAD